MSPNVINWITNIVAFLLVVLEPLRAYFGTQAFSWDTFLLCLGGAVIGYFTGKSALFKKAVA